MEKYRISIAHNNSIPQAHEIEYKIISCAAFYLNNTNLKAAQNTFCKISVLIFQPRKREISFIQVT